jgi:type IV pilus assembly protein PilA
MFGTNDARHTSMTSARRERRFARFPLRGFTLIELMIAVAMVGVLAALAIVGYRRYMEYSKAGDATAVLSAIRSAEESYRAETLSYLSCSPSLTSWYPASPDGKKRHWLNPSHTNYACWRMLNVVTDSPTRYGYAVVAGGPGTAMPVPDTAQKPTWPTPTTEPWYVVQAKGDNDGDSIYSMFLTSSLNGEIYSEAADE